MSIECVALVINKSKTMQNSDTQHVINIEFTTFRGSTLLQVKTIKRLKSNYVSKIYVRENTSNFVLSPIGDRITNLKMKSALILNLKTYHASELTQNLMHFLLRIFTHVIVFQWSNSFT